MPVLKANLQGVHRQHRQARSLPEVAPLSSQQVLVALICLQIIPESHAAVTACHALVRPCLGVLGPR